MFLIIYEAADPQILIEGMYIRFMLCIKILVASVLYIRRSNFCNLMTDCLLLASIVRELRVMAFRPLI